MFFAYYYSTCGTGETLEMALNDLEEKAGELFFGEVTFYEGEQINVVLQKKEFPVKVKDKKETL